ncbi:hypothetical protein [Gemmatimonas sp.]|uniref:hypothetical protein n=1 Tax=Gemmatimonas sp. TaxID=1962908 RepID=UPI003DA3C7E6
MTKTRARRTATATTKTPAEPSYLGAFHLPSVGMLIHEPVHDYGHGESVYSAETTLTAHGDLRLKVTRCFEGSGPLHSYSCGELTIEHPEEVSGVVEILRKVTDALPRLLEARAAMQQAQTPTESNA